MLKKTIALALTLIMLVSVIPINSISYAAPDSASGNGTGTGSGGGEGSGTMSETRTGYRMYIYDPETNKVVSNVVDFVNESRPNAGWICYNTKFEDLKMSPNIATKPEGYKYYACKLFSSVSTSGNWPTPINWTNSRGFFGQGKEFKKWFIGNISGPITVGGTGNYNSGYVYTKQPSTSNWNGTSSNKGSSGSSGSSGQSNSGSAYNKVYGTTQDIQKILDQVRRSAASKCYYTRYVLNNRSGSKTFNMSAYDKAKALSYVNSCANTKFNEMCRSGRYSDATLNAVRRTVAMGNQQWNSFCSNHGYKNASGKSYGWYTFEAYKVQRSAENLNTQDLFQIAYAAEKTDDNPNGVDLKDLNITKVLHMTNGDNYLFVLNNTPMSKTVASGILNACALNNYRVMVEPLIWFRPTAKNGATNVYFYGTPTNYAQMLQTGQWNNQKTDYWYKKAIRDTMSKSMYLQKDLKTESGTVRMQAPVIQAGAVDTGVLKGRTKGFAIHEYSFKGGKGLPSISTYDSTAPYYKGNAPHPAQDPSPDKIPLGKAEPKEAGELTPFVPGDPPKLPEVIKEGYKTQTRNIHIVKVYEKEKLDGTRVHMKTTVRDYCPGSIEIRHEPDYKVVEYFPSKDYYPYVSGIEIAEDTTWDSIIAGINDGYYKNVVDNSKYKWVPDGRNDHSKSEKDIYYDSEDRVWREKKTDKVLGHYELVGEVDITYEMDENAWVLPAKEWDTVKKTEAGELLKTIDIGYAADPEHINTTDPTKTKCKGTAAKDYVDCDHMYHDTTLYVRLLIKEEPPETHTWDFENYPEEPGPAPDPDNDPSRPLPPDIDPEILEIFKNYRIVKTYEILDQSNNDTIEHVTTTIREKTFPLINIENENDYKVIEWKYGGPYQELDSSVPWTDSRIQSVPATESGTKPKYVDIRVFDDQGLPDYTQEVTLYVRLQKVITEPDRLVAADEDLTESQLTKLSGTSGQFNFGDYTYTMHIPAAKTWCPGCHCVDCSCKKCKCKGVSMSRLHSSGKNYVSATFTEIEESKFEFNNLAAFQGQLYSSGKLSGRGVTFKDDNVGDEAKTEVITANGESSTGIEYYTTISRKPVDPNVTIASYKENAMNANSYKTITTMFSKGVTPVGNRAPNGRITDTMRFVMGHTPGNTDNVLTSVCYSEYEHKNTKYANYEASGGTAASGGAKSAKITFAGAFNIFTYGGLKAKTAEAKPTNIKDFLVPYSSSEASKHSALFVSPQTSRFSFYPYIKMSYMITKDHLSFPGYTAPNDNNARTVYVLSDKKSTILPSNSAEVSWYNKTQQEGGYGLQMTSLQWSTHSRSTDGSDVWKQKNQVLPGGALYTLSTTGTESYIKVVTYNNLVEQDSRNWISLTDGSKYTVQSIVDNNKKFLDEAERVIDNYRIVEWVNKNYKLPGVVGPDSPIENGNSVKIRDGNESLSKLDLSTKSSTDSKYLLFNNGKAASGASEADLDIITRNYQVIVYKAFSDIDGNVYLMQLSLNNKDKKLDTATLNNLVNMVKAVCGTNKATSISGTTEDMSYTLTKIGTKTQGVETILSNLQAAYNAAYMMDLKTKYITNTVKAIERNTGDDLAHATWTEDGKWYNEAFDGTYMVVYTATYKMGLHDPNKRVSILDPNLCPAKTSTGNIYTTAHISQFCIDEKSTEAPNEENGYVGTFENTKVYLPDLKQLFYTRPFFIPNANVQDLS